MRGLPFKELVDEDQAVKYAARDERPRFHLAGRKPPIEVDVHRFSPADESLAGQLPSRARRRVGLGGARNRRYVCSSKRG
jgi:hypothetical protein